MKHVAKHLTALFLTFAFGVSAYLLFNYLTQGNGKHVVETLEVYLFEFYKPLDLPKGSSVPNVCHLTLQIDENQNLALNGERFGKLDNTTILKARLAEIMKVRAMNGVYKENSTSQIENTVIVRVAYSVKATIVISLLKDLESVGAKPFLFNAQDCLVKIDGKCFEFDYQTNTAHHFSD